MVIFRAAGYPAACCGEESGPGSYFVVGVGMLGSADGIKAAWNSLERAAMLSMI